MLARERIAQNLSELRLSFMSTPTPPSPARRPKGGDPAARWTLFAPHTPNSVARAGERAVDGRARASKTRATQLLSSEIDQPLGALARHAMRRAFFYPLGSVVVGYTLLDFTPGADLPEEVLDWCRLPAGLMRDPWGNPWLS